MRPEVGTARENEAMEVVGGAHRVDNDVGEGAGTESLHLNVVTKGGEIAIQCPELAAAPVIVRELRRGLNRHFHQVRSICSRLLLILTFHC